MARIKIEKRCRKCGVILSYSQNNERTLCDTCREKARRESVIRPRTCVDCGTVFQGYPASKRCPSCSAERKRELDRAHRKRGTMRPLGSTQICEVCGGEYILESGRQRYCKACSEEAVRQNRLAKKRIYQAGYDPGHIKRRASRKGTRYCGICGKVIPEERSMRGIITCSDACDRIRRRQHQTEADLKRGKRKAMDRPLRAQDLPVSGVKGVTARRTGKPWQATYKGHYIGTFDTVEEAAKALEDYKRGMENM